MHLVECTKATSLSLIRFRAVLIKVQGLTFIFATLYFYDRLGPTHTKDYNIFTQLELLLTVCKLPVFVHADFNCTPQRLSESGWPKRLKLEMLVQIESTIQKSDKVIQFTLVSPCLFPVCSSIAVDHDVPWYPHDG